MNASKQCFAFMTARIMAPGPLQRSNSSMSCKHNLMFVDKCFARFIQNELKLCVVLGKYLLVETIRHTLKKPMLKQQDFHFLIISSTLWNLN